MAKKKTVKKKSVGKTAKKPVVGIVMGSASDWDTMQHCKATLEQFGVPCEARVLSAHRTPEAAGQYAVKAASSGLKIIIAAAGGAAHLAGAMAANTELPVLGVPMKGWSLDGLDSLLATVQMPRGIPVPTLAIGKAGAVNAALSAVAILALSDSRLRAKLKAFRAAEKRKSLAAKLPES